MFVDFGFLRGPRIVDNVIIGNSTNTSGGGIGLQVFGACEIVGNHIEDNEARLDGGGIWLFATTTEPCRIEDNVIVNNRAADHAGGVTIFYVNSLPQPISFRRNLVANNHAGLSSDRAPLGAGMWTTFLGGEIVENTFYGNMGGEGGPTSTFGMALEIDESRGLLVERNIFAGHNEGRSAVWCFQGTHTLRNNLGWNDIPNVLFADCPEWSPTDGNITADPQFCNAESGDFTLAAGSPALTHPAGPLGAYGQGCDPVSVEPTTWGRLKARFRDPGER